MLKISQEKGSTKRMSAHKDSDNQFLDSKPWKLLLLSLCSSTSGLPLSPVVSSLLPD